MDKFTFTGTRACGIKDGLRADGSFRMTNDSLDYLWNPEAPADWFVKFPLRQCADLFGLPYTGTFFIYCSIESDDILCEIGRVAHSNTSNVVSLSRRH